MRLIGAVMVGLGVAGPGASVVFVVTGVQAESVQVGALSVAGGLGAVGLF